MTRHVGSLAGPGRVCPFPDAAREGPSLALTAAQRAELLAVLKKRPPDGGLWTGPKVAAYVRDRRGVRVWPQTGWRWLEDLGFTLQVPRPRHPR